MKVLVCLDADDVVVGAIALPVPDSEFSGVQKFVDRCVDDGGMVFRCRHPVSVGTKFVDLHSRELGSKSKGVNEMRVLVCVDNRGVVVGASTFPFQDDVVTMLNRCIDNGGSLFVSSEPVTIGRLFASSPVGIDKIHLPSIMQRMVRLSAEDLADAANLREAFSRALHRSFP